MALCGVYSRAATNRGAAFIRVNTVIIKFIQKKESSSATFNFSSFNNCTVCIQAKVVNNFSPMYVTGNKKKQDVLIVDYTRRIKVTVGTC